MTRQCQGSVMSRPAGTPVRRWAIVVLFALTAQFMGPLSGAAQAFPLRFWLPVSQEEPTPEASSEVPGDDETDGGESAAMTDSEAEAAAAEDCTVATPSEIASPVNDLAPATVPECLSDPTPLPTPVETPSAPALPECDDGDADCLIEVGCVLADAETECAELVGAADCATDVPDCPIETLVTEACESAPEECLVRDVLECGATLDTDNCETALFTAVSNALCGVAGDDDCVPEPVVSLRACIDVSDNGPTVGTTCATEVAVTAVCGPSPEEPEEDTCLLRHPAVLALASCTEADTYCDEAIDACAAGPSTADCPKGLREVIVGALCEVEGAPCLDSMNDAINECPENNNGCVAAAVFNAACAGNPPCPAAVKQLEPCVANVSACSTTFFRRWLGRTCAGAVGANNAVCPRNPYVHATGGVVVTVPDGPSTRVPFQNGSSNFPYAQISEAVTALRSGGTNESWALASPVKVRSGTYGRLSALTLTPGTDEEIPMLIIVADTGNQDITIDGAGQAGVVIPTGRAMFIGPGVKVRGGIQGPEGSAGIFTTSGRVNVNQAADYAVSSAIATMPAPEPVEQRVVIQSSGVAASDVIVEHLRDGTWVTLSATSTASGLSYTLSTIEDVAPPIPEVVGTYKYAKVEVHSPAQLRVTPKTGATLQVAAQLVGTHTTTVYASASAAPVHVVVGQPYEWPTSGATPRPTPTTPEAPGPLPVGDEGDRLSGEDRSSTAAAVSRSSFSGGADTVYIATGAAYADALAAGPAAVRSGGPVLLVERDRLPDATRTEVQRLRPRRIVLLGGTQAIGAAVEQELARMANGLDRIKGSDRYATAAAVSAAHFAADVPVVYVSSGEGFADALSGGAAAATQRGPVLLVRPDSIPSSSAEELRRLGPARIVVLGGTKAVSEAVASQLRAYTDGGVHRVSGSTRYATSAAVSRYAFASRVSTVYIATGESFPDALAGVPAAGAAGSPLLLVQPDRLPQEVAAELDRLRPERIVILGGERSVSLRLERELRSYETAA